MSLVVTRHTPIGDLPELLTVEEAATFIGCKKGLLYALVKRGELRSVRFGRLLRISRDGLADYIEQSRAS